MVAWFIRIQLHKCVCKDVPISIQRMELASPRYLEDWKTSDMSNIIGDYYVVVLELL